MEPIGSFGSTDAGEPELHGVLSNESAPSISPVRLRLQVTLCASSAHRRPWDLLLTEAPENFPTGFVCRLARVWFFGPGSILLESIQFAACCRADALDRVGNDCCAARQAPAQPDLRDDPEPPGHFLRAATLSLRSLACFRIGSTSFPGIQRQKRGGLRHPASWRRRNIIFV